MARPIAQAVSLEKFHGTDRSAKTVKLFHLERFAIYGILTIVNTDFILNLLSYNYVLCTVHNCLNEKVQTDVVHVHMLCHLSKHLIKWYVIILYLN